MKALPQRLLLICYLYSVCRYEAANKMNMGNLSLIWAMTLFQPDSVPPMPAPPMSPTGSVGSPDGAKSPSLAVQSATSNSMIQTMVLHEIFKAFTNGTLELGTGKSA